MNDSLTYSNSNGESFHTLINSIIIRVLQETLSPVSVTIPKYTNNISNVLVLEPPSPYRNPTVEQPPPVPKTFYFGENFKAAIEGGGDSGGAGVSGTNNSSSVENALISDAGTFENKTDAMDEIKGSQKIEVVHFGQV